jgi:predicted transcriptional regulator
MSPTSRVAAEELVFKRVYHFVGGKGEWIERGLPTEGIGPFLLLAGQVVRPATATFHPDTLAGTVRREGSPGSDFICAVVNDQNIVVGRVRWKDLPEDDNARVETFMALGPATVRPREELPTLLERMRHAGVKTILVTTARGQLVGVVNRDDGERFVRNRAAASRQAEAVT